MKIIDPEIFYNILITGEIKNNLSELSLYALNTEKDEDSRDGLRNKFDLEVFNESGEWLENQRNEFNTENDIEEKVYGNFNYLSTVLDESSYILPQYTEIFKIELIVPEKFRNIFIPFFDGYAAQFNNKESEYDGNDIFITLGENSTPAYGDKEDIGGMERFVASFSLLVRVSTNAITTKKIKLQVETNTGAKEDIKYVSFNLKRESDLNVDNSAGNTKLYDIQKTDLSAAIACLYTDNYLSRTLFEFMLDEDMEKEIKIIYKDEVLDKETTFNFYIGSVNVNYQFGQPISYTATFKLKYK